MVFISDHSGAELRERYIRCEGIVLNSVKFGEGHKIVRIFTDAYGKINATAFGARKTKSRFGSTLEPFTIDFFLLYRKNLESPYTISESDVREYNETIRTSLQKYYCANSMIEPIIRFIRDGESDESLFDLISGTLRSLNRIAEEKILYLFFTYCLRLITVLGYKPDIEVCVLCGKRMNEENSYSDPHYGFPLCQSCKKDSSTQILPSTKKFFQWASTAPLEYSSRLTMKQETLASTRILVEHIFKSIFQTEMKTWKELFMMHNPGT